MYGRVRASGVEGVSFRFQLTVVDARTHPYSMGESKNSIHQRNSNLAMRSWQRVEEGAAARAGGRSM